jgi:hypothetical protein
LKHHLVASFYASLVSVASLLFIDMYENSGTSIVGGLLLMPIIFVCCLVLAYPLIYIRSQFKLKKLQSLILFIITGFILGAGISLFMFPWLTIDSDSIVFILQYSFVGFVASITAWLYVQRNIAI